MNDVSLSYVLYSVLTIATQLLFRPDRIRVIALFMDLYTLETVSCEMTMHKESALRG